MMAQSVDAVAWMPKQRCFIPLIPYASQLTYFTYTFYCMPTYKKGKKVISGLTPKSIIIFFFVFFVGVYS